VIRLFNTQTRKKETLEPRDPGKVRMYVCGPTVYNYIHIGNARTFISFDVIRRYLAWRGFEVTFVQNITDVDDKIIAAAAEERVTPAEIATKYEAAYLDQMDALGIAPADVAPKATQEIGQMIALVQRLIETGHAYAAGGDVYFDVRGWPAYGSLSGRTLEEMRAGERVEVNPLKRDPMDFALWKAAKPGEPKWDSPWGPGRPGWHLECSAMSERYLGLPLDIHGGASDLVFPHHENEKAQSEAATGEQFVRYWIHGGLLNIDKEKMSKSLGNFTLLRDVLGELASRGFDRAASANIVRMLMLGTHYRSPLEFSPDRLDEAAAAVERLETAARNLAWVAGAPLGTGAAAEGAALAAQAAAATDRFTSEMDDDFNTAGAMGGLFELVRAANAVVAAAGDAGVAPDASRAADDARRELLELAGVLGLRIATSLDLPAEVVGIARELAGYAGDDADEAAAALLDRRAEARGAKEWAVSDAIRDRLASVGLAIEDTPQGQRLANRA
jgi:cysteinyl-tRNA synthetase